MRVDKTISVVLSPFEHPRSWHPNAPTGFPSDKSPLQMSLRLYPTGRMAGLSKRTKMMDEAGRTGTYALRGLRSRCDMKSTKKQE